MSDYIEHNKKMFGRRIKQLQHIIKDESYIPNGSTSGYHEFILSMYRALITGRKITPKMESAITKIVKVYSKHHKNENNSEYQKKKLDYIENTLAKLNRIRRLLYECKFTRSYESNSEYFLDSVQNQVHKRGSLSMKQRKALNKMHIQFTKRIEKGTLSPKNSWDEK